MNRQLPIPGATALLRRLRQIMAETLESQARLDEIARAIAANMYADVCSVYVLQDDGSLELYATEGLRQDAVHVSTLQLGQGLVGTVASTAHALNLINASEHPAFEYLPETGEEAFTTFLGVPTLRNGRVLGVLVLQKITPHAFAEYEIEALETVAMVLADLMASGDLEGLSGKGTNPDSSRPLTMNGAPLSDGIGIGHVVLHEPRVAVLDFFSDETDSELARLHEAMSGLQSSIDSLIDSPEIGKIGEHVEVLEAYRMFARDRGWRTRIEEAIQTGLSAEAAVEKVRNENRARMHRQSNPYLAEQLHDLDDLANRLLRQLVGQHELSSNTQNGHASDNMVIVARSMGAAELLDYDVSRVRGLVLEDGGPTSHVAIVARALGIPALSQLKNFVVNAEVSNAIIVDGNEGMVSLRPPQDVRDAYEEKLRFLASRQKAFSALRQRAPVSRDGQGFQLLINGGLQLDVDQMGSSGADGIGLFRTELQFMISARLPRPGEQETIYRNVLERADDMPVTFRALDVGGDKIIPWMEMMPEENPAMGWRGMRLSLDRPTLFKSQMRALLRAAAGRTLRVMLPLVTDVSELVQAREILHKEREVLERQNVRLPKAIQLGAMLEVPALLWQMDELFQQADFVSVGTNDLFQFTFASDRGHARLANRYSTLSKPFLRLLKSVVLAGKRHGKQVTLCGEMAGRPLNAMALFALGFRSLSMATTAIGPVKAMALNLNIAKLEEQLLPALELSSDDQTIGELLVDFADRHTIPY